MADLLFLFWWIIPIKLQKKHLFMWTRTLQPLNLTVKFPFDLKIDWSLIHELFLFSIFVLYLFSGWLHSDCCYDTGWHILSDVKKYDKWSIIQYVNNYLIELFDGLLFYFYSFIKSCLQFCLSQMQTY